MSKFLIQIKRNNGQSLIELIIVMSMIALLGGVLLGLVSTGGSAYQKVSSTQDLQREARLALSYVTVKVRQNDVQGGIPLSPLNKIRILKVSPATGYWDIYVEGANLVEEDDTDANPATPGNKSVIAENVGFTARQATFNGSKQIIFTITYGSGKTLNETITLRSDNP